MVSPDWKQVVHFWQNYHRNSVLSCTSYGQVSDVGMSCSGNGNLDHLVQVESARFSTCEMAVFPFVVNRYLGGDSR